MTTPSDNPANDEYDDLALRADELFAKLQPEEGEQITPLDAQLAGEAALAAKDVRELVARCREAEGLVRLALPFLSKYGRIEKVMTGESASPGLVAVGGAAKQIIKVMDKFGDEKREAVARPTPEG